MTAYPTPPAWASLLLRSVVRRRDAENVAGDLLEAYRDSIHPARGSRGANRWYITQVAGFVSRSVVWWAVIFAAAFEIRNAFDWFLPVHDFHTRSMVTTQVAANVLLAAGAWTAWRSGSILAGPLAGMATTAIAALMTTISSAAMLAVWHDSATMAAIAGSGGIAEVFVLPYMAIVLGTILGAIGGIAGTVAHHACWFVRARRSAG